MDLLCPRCNQALSVPEQMAGGMVQCPFCTTVLQVPAAVSAGYAAAPAAGPAAGGMYPGAPAPAVPDFSGFPTRPSGPVTQRPGKRKSNSSAGLMMLGMAVVLAGGLAVMVYVAAVKHQEDQQALAPMQIAAAQAQEFVRQNLPDAKTIQFPVDGVRAAQTNYGGWIVESDVDVTDSRNITGRTSWKEIGRAHV